MAALLKVVVVGQTPPPYGGQAVMIQHLLDGSYDGVELHHVRLAFSHTMAEIGHPSARKVAHLLAVVLRLVYTRIRQRTLVLYYPPAGPDRVPVYRDLFILGTTRWMFDKTIFHFHAGGLSEVYPGLPRWLRWAFRRAYYGADIGVRTSPLAPPDPIRLQAQKDIVVPYGIPDAADRPSGEDTSLGGPPTILFVGVLRESKGVLVLLEACADLLRRGCDFRAILMGEFSSPSFESQCRKFVGDYGLRDLVVFPGVLSSEGKFRAFAAADIFCLPSFFEAETFGVVLLEAMQFGLPIVATHWRGIPAVVADGVNGYLIPVRDAPALADVLERLINQPAAAAQMGATGRRMYEDQYTLASYHRRLQSMFDNLRPVPAL